MKKLFALFLLWPLLALSQGVKQSGWTTTTVPATARISLGITNDSNGNLYLVGTESTNLVGRFVVDVQSLSSTLIVTRFTNSEGAVTIQLTDLNSALNLLTNQTFLTGLGTNQYFLQVLASNNYFLSVLTSNQTFLQDIASNNYFSSVLSSNSTFNTFLNNYSQTNNSIVNITINNLATNAAAVSNILFTLFPDKYNSNITQSQTNYVYDDIRNHQTFTVASGATITISASSTNAVEPAWGFAHQGGWTAYLLTTNNTIQLQNTNRMIYLSTIPTNPTNGAVFCSEHGNSVLVGWCPQIQ